MAKTIGELRKQVKPEIQATARAKALEIIADMTLSETRKARGLNQGEVAKRLNLAQPNISQIESRPDLLVSTLSQYIEALGGTLELHAKFPDGQTIDIKPFK